MKIDVNQIMEWLPHRFPMLLVDRVVEFEPDKSITAIKNVTINEPFFQGHFPGFPIMPGVMIVEAMAQVAALLFRVDEDNQPSKNATYYFVGIDKARFKKPVVPGDQLIMNITIKRKMRGLWKFIGTATVDGEVCCVSEFMCTYKED
jgi:3-hydroxyacyl-[acyl-carrier-protein] dehydratase